MISIYSKGEIKMKAIIVAMLTMVAVNYVCSHTYSSGDPAGGALRGEVSEQNISPEHIKEILSLAKKSVEDDFNVSFHGFFVGMSRLDAKDLAAYYRLKEDEFDVISLPGKAVSKLWFSLKGVRRITKGGSTLEELAQEVANQVGDLKGGWNYVYTHETIDGVVVGIDSNGLIIENKLIASSKPIVTKANVKREENIVEEIVAKIIANMVYIPATNSKIGRYEVTQDEWSVIMDDNPSRFSGAENPVDSVSWDDCQEFIKRLNARSDVKASGLRFRLPTDIEWGYACRAGSGGEYCLDADGNEITSETLGNVAWYGVNSDNRTHPVGKKKPNAYGIYDMHGNVFEWCEDRDSKSFSVYRGGGCYNNAYSCGADYRSSSLPCNRDRDLGFRLAAFQE